MSAKAESLPGFRTASEILREESDPATVVRRLREVRRELDRLQRWSQQIHGRTAKLEAVVARIEDTVRTAEMSLNGIRADLCELRGALDIPHVQGGSR